MYNIKIKEVFYCYKFDKKGDFFLDKKSYVIFYGCNATKKDYLLFLCFQNLLLLLFLTLSTTK